jgi:uncharacterized YceG family protein
MAKLKILCQADLNTYSKNSKYKKDKVIKILLLSFFVFTKIYNRLKKDMLLQIDATVIYGMGKGKEHKTVYQSELDKPGPFNTYTEKGLPPGPIASPGKESIEAALYPEEHNYLYYVLRPEENEHVFNETYNEHLKDRAKYLNRNKK